MSQKIRDAVGTLLLQLTLKELFEWRFMQTDPNWGNFLYDESAAKLNLIDFGAAREFPSKFVDNYLSMVKACAERDREGVINYSTRLGFLTGQLTNYSCNAWFSVLLIHSPQRLHCHVYKAFLITRLH